MNNDYDVIVVGAGPAGSMAAMESSRGGARTLLLEKHAKIGVPVCCAEGITTLGMERVIKPRPEWISNVIEGASIIGPRGNSVAVYHPAAGYILDRAKFDAGLAEMARQARAEIAVSSPAVGIMYESGGNIRGVIVNEGIRQTEITGRVIIAADGVESRIATMAGIDSRLKLNDFDSACQYLVDSIEVEERQITVEVGNEIAPGGYAWVFPKGAKRANVGVAICPARSNGRSAKKYLDEFIASRYPECKILTVIMGTIPAFDKSMPLRKGNLLIVGDAARLLDSLSMAGISNALISGSLAGQAAARYCTDGADLDDYPMKFMSLKRKELNAYRLFRTAFLNATDEEFERIIDALNKYFSEKKVRDINIPEIIFRLLFRNPGLLKMARYLLSQ